MNQNDLELIGRDWFRILESSRKPSELEFSAWPTELSDIWEKFSLEWDQHLPACFRASRGLNPPRFETGPSELESSALPTELSDVWIIILRYETNTWPKLQSQPRIEPTEVWNRTIWTRVQRVTNWAKWHLRKILFGMRSTLGCLLQSQPRIEPTEVWNRTIWTRLHLSPTELSDIWKIFSLVWDQQLAFVNSVMSVFVLLLLFCVCVVGNWPNWPIVRGTRRLQNIQLSQKFLSL